MPWLARLDSSAKSWPAAFRYIYLSFKWLLVGLGAYGAIGLCIMELRERRVGLGTGITVALVFAGIKGTIGAFRLAGARRDCGGGHAPE